MRTLVRFASISHAQVFQRQQIALVLQLVHDFHDIVVNLKY